MGQPVPTAEAINAQHRLCQEAAASAVEHAMNAGEMLMEVKASSNHGEFGPWLEENFEGSARTAQTYMRLHRNRHALNAQRSAHLSIDGALKALSEPKDEASPEKDTSWKKSGAQRVRQELEALEEWQAKAMAEIHPGIEIAPRGLKLPDDLTFEQYKQVWKVLDTHIEEHERIKQEIAVDLGVTVEQLDKQARLFSEGEENEAYRLYKRQIASPLRDGG